MNRRDLLVAGALLPIGLTARPASAESIPIPSPALLIEAAELKARLDAGDPIKVVAFGATEEFAQGHIPGAAQVDWPELEIVETSDQQVATWRGEVEGILTRVGLLPVETVVIYDSGTLWAARLWWVLEQLGHADKAILNGGLGAWTAIEGTVEAGDAVPPPASEPYAGTPNDAAVATLDEVVASLDDANVVFVDARSEGEYAAGHLPGAINVDYRRNAADDGHWLSPDELGELYGDLGVTPDKRVIAYCSSGVRSAATYVALKLAGYPDVRLFTGSFQEWASHPDLPVTTGSHP